ncbi:Extracellular solute-binding protein [Botrimarina colliarenosi]|uniref:Extracellular solute-binding protein n=1 Tax=Botrimarina colliarenosi TaxID=2528001 RepID=A0A5C6AIK0_9BACT|nr:ABC transporter substrate-binding protein [Botrimarina colliarenosi]TWT98063.1 Extracellular solute-binding protein [Botrimarina colliarenosi]
MILSPVFSDLLATCFYRTRLVALALGVLAAVAHAAETPLYERQPSDLVVLNAASDSARLEVLPLPNRTPGAAAPRSGELIARLIDAPGEEIAIPASSIERVELFEERLLSAAKANAAKGDFNAAYDYFARLDRDYRDYTGFKEAFSKALYDEARARFAAGEYDHALALLQSLKEFSPRAEGLVKAVEVIGDAILNARWDAEDYLGVRRTADAIETQFVGMRLTLGERWLGRIAEGAQRQREKAEKLAAAGKIREALRVASGAVALDPNSPETSKLLQRLSSAEGTLWVGVWETAAPDSTPGLDTPAARRASRLVGGRLATLEAYLPAGGEYATTAGQLDVDDGRKQLSIRFTNPSSGGAYELARLLLEPSHSASDPLSLLRERAASVSVVGTDQLQIDLKTPYPQPLALAAASLPPHAANIAPGAWRRVRLPEGSEASVRYERLSGGGGFRAIEEFVYSDLDEAMAALRAQQIHVLTGVPPWKLSEAKATPGVRLAELRLPTLHCLLLHPTTPLRERREVRRAVVYGIAREVTLKKVVLGGEELEGFAVLSTAAPRGKSLGDPLRYAYNESIEPRPYEPRLAALLLTAARAADAAAEDASMAPVPTAITLAHPPTPIARAACEAIRDQLGAVGLEVTLTEASEGELAAGRVDYDLRYAEITVAEPLVDVWRLFGPGGLAGECSPPMRDGLEKVVTARTGKAAVEALRDLHRIAYADLPLIPLWQTVESIAHQANLSGIGREPVDLYQTVDGWRVTAGGSR